MRTLYLLAHQDDEIGVFHSIACRVASGERVACAFMTDGAFGGVSTKTRNAESLAVLDALGLTVGNVAFVGEAAGIGDGKLVENLDKAHEALAAAVRARGQLDRIVMHAWEGGGTTTTMRHI